MIQLGVLVFEDVGVHFCYHGLPADRRTIGHKEHFLADRLEPFNISECLTLHEFFAVPKHAITIKKKDVIFEFLTTNTDNCGSLFCINAKRKIINKELAYMARKTGRINDTND